MRRWPSTRSTRSSISSAMLIAARRSWTASSASPMSPLTDALIRQGRLDDAGELVSFAVRDAPEGHPYAQAAAKLAQAYLATAKRDTGGAIERYEEAIALWDELSMTIDLSQTRIAFGRALRELGEPELAREQFELARETCAPIGATGLVAEVDRELALVGSRAG